MRHIKFTAWVLAFALVLSSSLAMAQDRHPALQLFEDKGFTVDPLGSAYGVDGWIIRNDAGQVQYAYTTPEGGLITGVLFDEKGQLYTSKQIEKFRSVVDKGSQEALEFKNTVEKSNAPKSELIYASIENAKWFAVGSDDAPYIYTFINPTCVHCVEFWNDRMKAPVDSGDLQIRFVPFGGQDANRNAAALLLTSPDAEKIWRDYAAGNKNAYDQAKVMNIPEGIYDAVDVNSGLFRNNKMPSVPFTIYRAPADGKIKIVAGVPENTMMILADFLR